MSKVAAVDIGATSGRVMIADIADATPTLVEIARFDNGPTLVNDQWVWSAYSLFERMTQGLETAVEATASSARMVPSLARSSLTAIRVTSAVSTDFVG
jgi:sugar (pentulose or hexulose) kinase